MNESALKARLKSIAKEKQMTFNQVWKQLLLERFLARLSRSKYQDKFIFKGGLLLAQYLPIGRETMDIDFSVRNIHREMSIVSEAIKEICYISIGDGMQFEFVSIKELAHSHMEYDGVRVTTSAKFGVMKDMIQIDIAFGDNVTPIVNQFYPFHYKGQPIFEGEITLSAYPINTIFSEKLESVVSRGILNSRMKDYHDLLLLMRNETLLEKKKLADEIRNVFHTRGTKLVIPMILREDGIDDIQALWSAHLDGLGEYQMLLKLPEKIQSVIEAINNWIQVELKMTEVIN